MLILVFNDTKDSKQIQGTCTFTCKDGPAGVETGKVTVPGDRRAPWGDNFTIALDGENCVARWAVAVDIYRKDGRFFRRHTLSRPTMAGACWPDVRLMVNDAGIYILS